MESGYPQQTPDRGTPQEGKEGLQIRRILLREGVKRGMEELIRQIKDSILGLEGLEEAEAIGTFGSLARGRLHYRSDIDIFVVVKEKGEGIDVLWYRRIRDALSHIDMGVTVLVYSLKGLRKISNWYVLRLAKEAVILYDKGEVRRLFTRTLEEAKKVGLEEDQVNGYRFWRFRE
jgi:predicted nucleotidyltransferase